MGICSQPQTGLNKMGRQRVTLFNPSRGCVYVNLCTGLSPGAIRI